MKAVFCSKYGSPEVLHLVETPTPEPHENEILIEIQASAVNSGDCRVRKADPFLIRLFFGFSKPKNPILGNVLSGVVKQIGSAVTQFKVGDEVFGTTDFKMSTYAQYIALPETTAISLKPENMTHEEAASIPFGGHTALHFLKNAHIQEGQKILVYGASGAVGTAAVQIAKYYGARVTAVCSTDNVEMLAQLGADTVWDYTKKDISVMDEKFDLILETVNKTKLSTLTKLLAEKGRIILIAALFKEAFSVMWFSKMKKVSISFAENAKVTADDMKFLKTLAENNSLRAVIDKTYALEDIVQAHAYVDTGHKKGNVVIRI